MDFFDSWNNYNESFYLIEYLLPTEDLEDLNLIKEKYDFIEQYNFKEGQSQVNPMFKEALLVSMITSLDSQMSIMKKIIEDDQDSQDFTSHYNFFKTTIY